MFSIELLVHVHRWHAVDGWENLLMGLHQNALATLPFIVKPL